MHKGWISLLLKTPTPSPKKNVRVGQFWTPIVGQYSTPEDSLPGAEPFTVVTRPTALQSEAFRLLGVRLKRTQ